MISNVNDALELIESTEAVSVSGYDPWSPLAAPDT
jgi:hypothetical protein